MSTKRRVLLEAGAIGALALLSAWLQRGPEGIQGPYLAFLTILLGPALRRWLVLRGRARPAPRFAFALELAAFTGALGHPFGPWGLALAGGAALAGAVPRGAAASPPASGTERALPLVLGLAALGRVALADAGFAHPGSVAVVEQLAILSIVGLSPRASGTAEAAGRRAAVLALVLACACVLGPTSPPAGLGTELATLPLAWLGAALEVVSYLRERARGIERRASPRARRAARGAFSIAACGLVILLGPYRLALGERRVDLGTLPRRALEGHDRLALLPLLSLEGAPETARVLEDGRPLPFANATHEDVAALGSGRYAVWGRAVHFSSTDGTDPLANGRRYELAFRPDPRLSILAKLAIAGACAALLLAWGVGAIDLERGSSRAERSALLALVALVLGSSLPDRWNRVFVNPDSDGYVRRSPTRTVLYPAFVAALDRRPGEPQRPLVPDPRSLAHEDAQDRYVNVVRAQKLLGGLALLGLLGVLSGSLNAWFLGALTAVAGLVDLNAHGDASIGANLGSLISEGLNHPLVFLYLAAALAYLERPSWTLGLGLALLVSLLLLNRPANGPLAVVFALVWLRHARREGARLATLRTCALALACALPLLAACAHTQRVAGYFRLHAFTGRSFFCTAFELATPEDVDAFPEPVLHEFMRRCALQEASRVPADSWEYPVVNLYGIGLPVLDAMDVGSSGPGRDFVQDDVLGAVGKRLIARHPGAFAALVLRQLGEVVPPWTYGPIAACLLASAILYARTKRALGLSYVFLAALPVVSMIPSCVLNVPLARYRSQLSFLEPIAVLLFLAVATTRPAPEPADDA